MVYVIQSNVFEKMYFLYNSSQIQKHFHLKHSAGFLQNCTKLIKSNINLRAYASLFV